MKKTNQVIQEKIVGATGGITGAASILGSWQVCHNACLGIIALLSLIGITVVGMPLLFLTKLAVPFWIAAVILLSITVGFYLKKKCISKNLIMLNSGLIIAGIPFQSLQKFSVFFWVTGGALASIAIGFFIKERRKRK
ncbi:MAG TPA: hypothetical protein VJH97_02515 [Candidatus Nanoarchaeia archaeon]|nr:hypothetical protein [Candidatus Nanoarchaeia archaeon]